MLGLPFDPILAQADTRVVFSKHWVFASAMILVLQIGAGGCGKDTATAPVSYSSVDESAEASSVPTQPQTAGVPTEPESAPEPAPVANADPPEPVDPAEIRTAALTAFENGESDRAFRLARKARAAFPSDPEMTFVTANLLANRNRFPEAIKLLDDLAAERADARLPALGLTAEWMVMHGQWRDAEDRFRQLLNQVPDASMAQRALTSLLLRQGRRMEASDYLDALCRKGVIDPANLRAMLSRLCPLPDEPINDEIEPIGTLGKARRLLGKNDWDAALSALQQHSENNSAADDAEISALIARIHAQLQQWDDLTTWISSQKEPVANSADYWFAHAMHQANQDDHVRAVQSFCKAVLIDPTDRHAYQNLAESLREIQQDSAAATASERAKLIESTQQLGNQLAVNPGDQLDDISRLVELLGQLKRPLESLGWRTYELSLRHAQKQFSSQQTQQAIAAINQQRMELVKTSPSPASEAFILCGIDLNDLAQ